LIELALLAALAPLALFPTPGRFAALLAIPAVWVGRWLAGRPGQRAFVPRTPLDAAIVGLLVMVGVSIYATSDLNASLPKLAGVVYGVGVYYAVVRACRAWPASIAWAGSAGLALAALGVAGLGLLGTDWPIKFTALEQLRELAPPRLTGLPGAEAGFHPNEVAGVLAWLIPPLVATAAARGQGAAGGAGLSALLAGAALLALLVLALTQSRSAILGLGLALAGMLAAAIPRLRLPIAAVTALAGLAVACVSLVLSPLEVLRVAGGLGRENGAANALDTVEGRLETWDRALSGVTDFPLTGMGMNTFRLGVHLFYPMQLVAPGVDIGHAHNLGLQAALDVGLPGLVAYGGLWVGALAMAAAAWRSASRSGPLADPLAGALALGLAGGLLAHLIYGLTDAVALGARPGALWWAMLGLIAGLNQCARTAMNRGSLV
jgi:O-antigen ligase